MVQKRDKNKGEEQAHPILQTKLHRPGLVEGIVSRDRLHDLFQAGNHQHLTLVSAPAGYGKTTAVCDWLTQADFPSAWLSLDAADSELRGFINYLVSAVRTLFPRACPRTHAQLSAVQLASTILLAGQLVNELDSLNTPFVLVLDDFHEIRDIEVLELINHVIKHPPSGLRLILITRHDPCLSLARLRAHKRMTEVRIQDLCFRREEAALLFQTQVSQPLTPESVSHIHALLEGWPVGLCLTILALKNREDANAFLLGFQGEIPYLTDYLIEEVLDSCSEAKRSCLCRLSIVDRFCASLGQALCANDCNDEPCVLKDSGQTPWLDDSGLLCVPLDDSCEWYRYHHFFQKLLQQHLRKKLQSKEIVALHLRAANWFERKGLYEEALRHFLQAGDTGEVRCFVSRHRHALANQEQWHRLRHWLSLIPTQIVAHDVELLLTEAWVFVGYPEMVSSLDQADNRLAELPDNTDYVQSLQGELYSLRSLQYYAQSQGDRALVYSQQALDLLPRTHLSHRGFAAIIHTLSRQMMGDLGSAYEFVFQALRDRSIQQTTYHARLLVALCFAYWIEADLGHLLPIAKKYLQLGETLGFPESVAHGHFFLGLYHYDRYELTDAESHLRRVVENPSIANMHNFCHCAYALALIYQEQGLEDRALDLAETIVPQALGMRNPTILIEAQAFRAELALRQGRLGEAKQWALQFDPDFHCAYYRFYVPQLTLARVLLIRKMHTRASALLEKLHAKVSDQHNKRFQVEVLVLQALLQDILGRRAKAQDLLQRALVLAEPGRMVRPFVDAGSPVARLLQNPLLQGGGQDFRKSILEKIRCEQLEALGAEAKQALHSLNPPLPALDPGGLSMREQEVLCLIARRLTNKEIARNLFISPSTAKRHTANIYDKLGVNNRREAAAKAQELGLVHET